jgi:hypothetical protein
MNESLVVADRRSAFVKERAAARDAFAKYAYVAPHDRIAPEPGKAEVQKAPPKPVAVRVTQREVRVRGSNNWRRGERVTDRKRIADVVSAAAEVFGVSVDDLLSPSRKRSVAYPRFAAFHILHKVIRLSLPTIGKTFKRDHTTILSGVRKAAILRRKDPAFAGRSRLLAAELRRLWRVQ